MSMEHTAEELCGVLCIDKPEGFTSFDVIGKLRGMLRMRRLGHGGTLDPMATGVLPVFVGTATKVCDILPDNDKGYRAGFRLGIVTDTQDTSGNIISESDMTVSPQALLSAAESFTGEIMQLPPMYSAVSVNGKRLYEYAREGKEVSREARQICVRSLAVNSYDEVTRCGEMEILCSKGTYIRTIIHDIGEKLGCGAAMTSLRRTRACGFGLDDCVTFEGLAKIIERNELKDHLFPVERLFMSYDEIHLDSRETRLYKNGVKLSGKAESGGIYRVYGSDDAFIGLCRYDTQEKVIRVFKNF